MRWSRSLREMNVVLMLTAAAASAGLYWSGSANEVTPNHDRLAMMKSSETPVTADRAKFSPPKRQSWRFNRRLRRRIQESDSQEGSLSVFDFLSLFKGWGPTGNSNKENDFIPPSPSPSSLSAPMATAVDYNEHGTEDSPPLGIPLEPAAGYKDQGKIANVVGGADASPSEAPYFVMFMTYSSVRRQWEFTGCGGTLVSDRHVLTAGHCALGRDARLDAVYVGAYQPFWGNPGMPFHYSKLVSYTIHPDFDDGTNRNDVAVATLQKPADVTKFPPVMLAAPSTIHLRDGNETKVYGFGRQSYRSSMQVKTLQVVELPYLSTSSCRKLYGSSRVSDDMICSAGSDKDACSGDSGGPLIAVRSDGAVYQVGVVSWGIGCGSRPGVYASTQYQWGWIQSQVCSSKIVQSALCHSSSSSSLGVGASAVTGAPARVEEQAIAMAPSRVPAQGPVKQPTCPRRADGQSCTYGGQCCSGICRFAPASSLSKRICLGLAEAPESQTPSSSLAESSSFP